MSILKRCCGYKGQHLCADKYPDHMLPLEEFSKHPWHLHGVQDLCKMCMPKTRNTVESNYLRTISYRIAGGFDEYYALPREGRKAIRKEAKTISKVESSAAPIEDNLPVSKPSRKRISVAYGKPLPKEGWVYVMHTGLYNKIGKTWENGLRARRTEARRWGPADLVYWAWFDDAMAAEKEIHRRLKRYKVEKENVGEELFNCSVDTAKDEIKKLQEELEDYDREEQAVG